MSGLRIAMVGTRGVPATFGGIEHHVQEIGSRLAGRGHEVTVYCRSNYVPRGAGSHRGMRIRRLPAVGTKHLDAIAHSALSTLDAMGRRFDVVHYHALGPGLLAVLPRAAHTSGVVQTIHGLDDQRAKWGGLARRALGAAGWLSARVPDATIVVSRSLQQHYVEHHGRPSHLITNGVTAPKPRPPRRIVDELGLTPGRYVLFVGRLVPEKAPDLLVRAFRAVPGPYQLAIAGGSSFTDDYVTELERLAAADPRVRMAGYVYGDLLEELYTNAAAFCLPSFLEGLPLTLLEAASYARPLVASDIAPHVEVLGDDGPGHRLFPSGDQAALTEVLRDVVEHPGREEAGGAAVRERVLTNHDWDAAAAATEQVYLSVVGSGRRAGRALRPGSPTARDAPAATR